MGYFQPFLLLLWALPALAASPDDGDFWEPEPHRYPTMTTTIPYIGTHTTSTTLHPCGTERGTITVVIEIPLETQECRTSRHRTSSRHHSTTHSTPTPSPTPGGPCPADPFCPARGLNIDYYHNDFGGYSSGRIPSSYYISQNLRPLGSSLTTFFPQDNSPNLPVVFPDPSLPRAPYYVGWTRNTNGGVVVDANNFTLVYHGFYRAPVTGKYTLCITADNENDLFFGHGNAFSCATGEPNANAKPLIVSTGGNFINGINCTDVSLIQGQYYPIRNVMGDWQGPSAFNFTIKSPQSDFAHRTNDFTGLVYPHECGLFR